MVKHRQLARLHQLAVMMEAGAEIKKGDASIKAIAVFIKVVRLG